MPRFRVVLEVMEIHESEIDAADADLAEDTFRADNINTYGRGRRKVHFLHAWPIEEDGSPRAEHGCPK